LEGTLSGTGIVRDSAGNLYVTGNAGDELPVTPGAAQTRDSGGFVEKLSPSADRVLYATFVPGTEQVRVEAGLFSSVATGEVKGIAVDVAGRAYLTGLTLQTTGPATRAAQVAYGGGRTDAFVARLNADGTALDYWTYLGGGDTEAGNAIAV